MTPHLDAPRAKSWPVTTKNGAAGKFTERLRFVTPAQPFGILGVVLGPGRFTLGPSRLAKPAISPCSGVCHDAQDDMAMRAGSRS